MAALALNERQFSAIVVKSCCEVIYGKAISNDAWGNWRQWAKVPRRVRLLNFDQFVFLAAIAQIRSEDSNRHRELSRGEVEVVALDPDFQQGIQRAIEFLDASGKVVGRDAPIALASRGVGVSLQALYQKIPGFSVHKIYAVQWLEIMAA